MIYSRCPKEINHPLNRQDSLAPLIDYNARVNSRLRSAEIYPSRTAGRSIIPKDLCGSFPKCIHHSAVSAARFQPAVFVLLLSPRSSSPSRSLAFAFSSRDSPAELPAFHYFTQHAPNTGHSAHSRSRPSPLVFLFSSHHLPRALRRGSDSYSFFGIHVLFSASSSLFFFFFTSSYSGAALFGLERKRLRIGTTL